ncbi:methyltransferase, FkbM family [Pedobacter sp. ok626]|uniref:FkbM family methyltransferase n=1 Tax=Pedobacter sp. ok626 TaxID=1761882 RepID=UPI00088AD775|nr:FkbM family methyltransferase [Pedobacter sp. ok626]SDJ31715.1 methyltransferase, FkbM family [Pedobacter sp. ok626]
MIKKLLKKLKQNIKILTGSITYIKAEVKINHKWYGNTYGGFYVHPNVLNSKSIVYSFGIGEDISFDREIIKMHNCQVFGFDPTPKSIDWIKKEKLPSNFSFLEYGIDSRTDFVNFNLPINQDFVSGSTISHKNVDEKNMISVPMKSFGDITKELGHTHIDVLKMDIEGSEYHVIESILASDVKIDQILIELHERFFEDGKLRNKRLLASFAAHGYKIFAVSDSLEEVSFIKVKTA